MPTPETITFEVRNWLVGGVMYACRDSKTNQRHIASRAVPFTESNLYTLENGCGTPTCPNGHAMLMNRTHLVWYAPLESVAA